MVHHFNHLPVVSPCIQVIEATVSRQVRQTFSFCLPLVRDEPLVAVAIGVGREVVAFLPRV